MESPACLNEFEKLLFRLDSPRVVIDNAVCPNTTVVKVDVARKHGILLEAVQVITDLNLSINKAYISSDGRWFMDVSHVTDLNGNKLKDDNVINYMEQGYCEMSGLAISPPRIMSENVNRNQHTSLSMTNLGLGRLDSSMTMVRKRESVATMILGGFPTPLHPTIGHINDDLCPDNMSVLVINNDIQSQPLPLNVSSAGCKSFILGNILKQYCKWIKTIWKKLENKSSGSVGGINEDLRNSVVHGQHGYRL